MIHAKMKYPYLLVQVGRFALLEKDVQSLNKRDRVSIALLFQMQRVEVEGRSH